MRRIILPVLALVIVSSCTDVKINGEVGANTTNYMSMWTAHNKEVVDRYELKKNAVLINEVVIPKVVEKKSEEVVVKKEKIKYEIYELTAYTNGYESTQRHKGEKGYGITASGEMTKADYSAACPKSMKFGTKLYIPEMKHTYVCTDRGGAIKKRKLDIYMKTVKEAIAFGRRKVAVQVINPDES